MHQSTKKEMLGGLMAGTIETLGKVFKAVQRVPQFPFLNKIMYDLVMTIPLDQLQYVLDVFNSYKLQHPHPVHTLTRSG